MSCHYDTFHDQQDRQRMKVMHMNYETTEEDRHVETEASAEADY